MKESFINQFKTLTDILNKLGVDLSAIYTITEDDPQTTYNQYFGVNNYNYIKAGIYFYIGNGVNRLQAINPQNIETVRIGTIAE